MNKLETMKKLINNLLTVYSGTYQNTSPNEKIFHSSVQNSDTFATTSKNEPKDSNAAHSDNSIDTEDNSKDKESSSKDPIKNKSKDNLSLNIEEINFSLNRNISDEDTSEVSIILPKTEIKKTYYRNDKITLITEIVLNNLTIIHNPKVGPQIVTNSDNSSEISQDKPKLTIGFNTEEVEKP